MIFADLELARHASPLDQAETDGLDGNSAQGRLLTVCCSSFRLRLGAAWVQNATTPNMDALASSRKGFSRWSELAFPPINVWRFVMHKTLAVAAASGALLFGGAGVADASAPSPQSPSSTTTTVAQSGDDANHTHSDKTGLWGLLGLTGLAGLAGLRRRHDANLGAGTAGPGTRGQTPRV